MQGALSAIRFLQRVQFRAQVVRAQKIVRDAQASGRVFF
jgi:hypothetical protein